MNQEIEKRLEVQVAKCMERWDTFGKSLETQKNDTREILELLRGKGSDAGLVGHVQQHEERLNSISRIFKALWSAIVGIAAAVAGSWFKK